ncbi:MAG: glycosyltransferase [Planctomycetes bacterium]|nr:glycosyltransferase [Planctomycetota bacterium]
MSHQPEQPAPRPEREPPSGLLFDQWSRYAAVARGVTALLPDGGTVLDVGSGGAMLLGQFLPRHQITYLDPLLAGRDGPGVLGKPLDEAHVADRSFDVAVCVDVLEHVPAAARDAFLRQMVRASRVGIVVAAPFADVGAPKDTDDHVHLAYRAKTGRDYSWLHEHEQFGLPRFDEVERQLLAQGLQLASFGNGHTPWLQALLAWHVMLLDEPVHLPMLREVGDRFAAELMPFDHLEPTYRQVLVAARGHQPRLPPLPVEATTRAAAQQAGRRFFLWLEARLAQHADALGAETGRLRTRLGAAEAAAQQAKQQQQRAEGELATASTELAELRGARSRSAHAQHTAEQQAALALAHVAAVERSLSWRLTAPLRWVGRGSAAVRRRLLAAAAWLLPRSVPRRLRWPLKSAFFRLFAPLLRGSREYREFQAAARQRGAGPDTPSAGPLAPAGSRPLPPIPEPRDDRHDVVVFGVIDWHLRFQRPQQLARELARTGHRVFYLTPGFAAADAPGFELEPLLDGLPVYQVRLHTREPVSIYDGPPAPGARDHLMAGLRQALGAVRLSTSIALVDHPGWVEFAAALPRARVLYDCMDNHHGFAEAGSALPAAEARLLQLVDGVVVTSDYLERQVRGQHAERRMIRNACDPSHFLGIPPATSARPVVGYFGAVAQWFDVALLRAVATAMPDCDFLIVGDDTAGVARAAGKLPNVTFRGEVPYTELPRHLAAMHVLLIPFVIDELILATNPVKAYEALAAGRPVVATEMPELMSHELASFVRTAPDAAGIVAALRAALRDAADPARTAAFRTFAAGQTWAARAADLLDFVAKLPRPKVGVVVVSWNGMALTRRCVASVLQDPLADDVDLVIVDNASTDGTAAWLDEIATDPRVRVIRNADNRGFAAACNQGLAAAATRDPELLVILNNDLVVTPGWTATLRAHLRNDPRIGLIGPVTNNIGNEARIATRYVDLVDMPAEQRARTAAAAGRCFDIPVLAFFCVAMPLDVYRTVGGLDEKFGTGFFEDDDYCQRVRRLGRRLVCAEDVFVHHELSASFARIDQGERKALFERNRAYYESKWGPWQRHEYRPANGTDKSAAG